MRHPSARAVATSGVISRFMTISVTFIADENWLASTAIAGCAAGRAAIARSSFAPTPGGMERILTPRRDAASSMLRRRGDVGNPGSGLADSAGSRCREAAVPGLPDPRSGQGRRHSPPSCRQLCSRPLSRPARSLRCNDRSWREAGSRAYSDDVCAIRPQYPIARDPLMAFLVHIARKIACARSAVSNPTPPPVQAPWPTRPEEQSLGTTKRGPTRGRGQTACRRTGWNAAGRCQRAGRDRRASRRTAGGRDRCRTQRTRRAARGHDQAPGRRPGFRDGAGARAGGAAGAVRQAAADVDRAGQPPHGHSTRRGAAQPAHARQARFRRDG